MDNQTIAQQLLTHARKLENEADNLYRVKAYRRAAETIQRLNESVADIVAQHGRGGLEQLPGIGTHLALSIERLVQTGVFRSMSHVAPGERVDHVPGVGPVLARLLEEKLGVTTLQELQAAARAGQLDRLGLGPKRLERLREALVNHAAERRLQEQVRGEPDVAELLAIDEEYRQQAVANRLPTIAPRRLNPENDAWLPLFHTRRNGWRYRALFSNTALAHRLQQTRDWVVVYFSNDKGSGQRTVVTEFRGDLRGRRVVRGRESECRAHYERQGKTCSGVCDTSWR